MRGERRGERKWGVRRPGEVVGGTGARRPLGNQGRLDSHPSPSTASDFS